MSTEIVLMLPTASSLQVLGNKICISVNARINRCFHLHFSISLNHFLKTMRQNLTLLHYAVECELFSVAVIHQ